MASRSAPSCSSPWSLSDHFGMRASLQGRRGRLSHRFAERRFRRLERVPRALDVAKELIQGEGRHEQEHAAEESEHLREQIPVRESHSAAIISVMVAIASRAAGVITAPGSGCTDRLIRSPNTGRTRSRTSWLMPRLPHRTILYAADVRLIELGHAREFRLRARSLP